MAMKKVTDVKFFWRWWSVQLGTLSASLAAAATAYGATYAIAPSLVAGVPQWVGVVVTAGAMLTAAAGVWLRRFVQEGLEP